MKWNLLEIGAEQARLFAERFQISPLAAEIFLRRAIDRPEDLRFFLDQNVRSAHNPFLFNDMENVVERISQAAAEKEKVLVCGDRDVDGITSCALLVRRLRSLGIEVSWKLPMDDSPYGLTIQAVDEASVSEITLIITVDCGITNFDEIARAGESGIDVIIIDHHNPKDEYPAAISIINPKIADSGYPFAGLCAAALVGKVNLALDFSKTDLYGQEQCLINLRPDNESLVFEAIKLRNLVEISRLTETITAGKESIIFNRIVPFIQGTPLYCYDLKAQLPLLKRLFGTTVDIYAHDLLVDIENNFPEMRGKSLLRMIPGSRLARFSSHMPVEIDALKNLAITVFQAPIKLIYKTYEEELGVIALSIVADMMPLVDENRIMVRRGLDSLQRLRSGGLHALLSELGLLQPPLLMRDIGWKITPVINSSGRMGRPDVALRLFLSDDPSDYQKLVKELVVMNEDRKKYGDEAWLRIRDQARSDLETRQGQFILIRDDEIPRGITGILAGKLAREFEAPSAVLAQVEDKLVGSIRSARGFHVTDFLSQFNDILSDWGGHDAAGGFYLPVSVYPEFSARLALVIENITLSRSADSIYSIDLVVPPIEMTENLWQVEEIFSPYGQESPQVLYSCRKAQIKSISLMGKEQNHVRLTIETGSRQWPAVYWDAVECVNRDFRTADTVDVLFHLEKNTYGANTNLQLNIVDIRKSTE